MNNDAAAKGMTDALNSGQAVPVTIDPALLGQRIQPITSGSLQEQKPVAQLPGPVAQQKTLSETEVRRWIYDHVRGGDTRGDTAILNTDTFLDEGDLLFKRIQSLIGKNILLVQDSESRFAARYGEDDLEPKDEDLRKANLVPTEEELIEFEAQERLSVDLRTYRIEQRYQELRAEAVKEKKLPKEKE